jgi:WD40 repeat protein
MSELDNVIRLSNLTDQYGTILQHRYLPEQELVLCKCETVIVFLSLSGAITDSIPVNQAETLVAIKECDTGHQILMRNKDKLCLIRNTPAGAERIKFSEAGPNSNTAVWSPCGRHIAVGHNYDSSVSVWRTDSGKLVWKQSTTWDTDGQCLQRPDLFVTGWSRDGRYIVTSSKYLIAWSIIIWHAESGNIAAVIN